MRTALSESRHLLHSRVTLLLFFILFLRKHSQSKDRVFSFNFTLVFNFSSKDTKSNHLLVFPAAHLPHLQQQSLLTSPHNVISGVVTQLKMSSNFLVQWASVHSDVLVPVVVTQCDWGGISCHWYFSSKDFFWNLMILLQRFQWRPSDSHQFQGIECLSKIKVIDL